MKTILITGGAGFIGSHLAKKLLDAGNKIICLDNFYTGSKENIAGFLKNKNFKLLKRDVARPLAIKADEIYNLACPASPRHYRQNPVKTIKTSVLGALNMFALAKKNKARILQASTSEVYGDPLEHPQKETYWGNVNPIGARSCYDEGKRLAETLCMDYWRQYKTEIRIVRIFNTYGPNMNPDDGRVVSNFIAQALQGKDLTIYGDGSQTRSFQYIDDLTEGMIRMMEQDGFIGPVNIGNPNEFTVKELADKVLKMIPESKSKIVYTSLPEDDPQKRKPDISLAKEKLGWEPKIELEEGLEKTIEYFRKAIKKVHKVKSPSIS